MGLKYLLDNNILSEPARPQPDANVLQKMAQYAGEYCTSVTVWHELHYGVERLPESAKKTKLAAYLRSLEQGGLPVLPYEKPAGVWLAQQRAQLSKQGISIPFAGGEIAAVACVNQLTVVTRNVADFSMYDGLNVENWFEG